MFVLYNAAHQNSRIKSFDGNAWIRVLGFFMTKDAAMSKAKAISSSIEGGLEIRIAPTEEFRLILNKNYSVASQSEDKERRKHNFLIQFYKEYKEKNKLEVEENAAKKQIGNIVFSPNERREYYNSISESSSLVKDETEIKDLIPEVFEKEKINSSMDLKIQTYPKDFQIRCQNFFAMAIIPDYEALMMDSQDLDVWKINYDHHHMMLKNNALRVMLEYHSEIKVPKAPTFIPEKNEQYSELFIKKFTEDLKEKWEKEVWELCGESYDDMMQRIDLNMKEYIKNNPVPVKTEKEEPAVAFLTVGDTSEEVSNYILKHKDEPMFRDYDVACICMYEWIRVSSINHPSIKKQYREEILSNIFKNRDENLNAMHALKKENPSMKVVEITA